jgi:AraC family transcriptional regulator
MSVAQQTKTASPDFLAEVLAHIEAHLLEPLSVASLAEVAGLSTYHFARSFTARFGESVMGYVRSRRLDVAAFRLSSAAPPPLAELAFDCVFESQEAFTRAFRRQFGMPPGQFKRHAMSQPKEQAMSTPSSEPRVEQLAGLTHRDGFTVAGVRAVFDDENKSGIPALWPRLIKCLPLAGQVDARTYGVCWSADLKEGSINYMAGVEVRGDAALPPGFEKIDIAAKDYAVFRLSLDGGPLHPQIQAAMPEIWGKRVPQSGLKLAHAPDFELYPIGFDPTRKGYMDIYLPVET